MATSSSKPACKNLVLDAGPLLSFSPLRNLAQNYYVAPQVISELKDPRAKEHFETLALNAGIRIQVRHPTPSSIAHTIVVAKKTGDYSVLSHADICVVALTYELDSEEKKLEESQTEQDREVEAVAEYLDQVTLEGQPVETPVETTPSLSPLTEIPTAHDPSIGIEPTDTRLPEPENTLPTPPQTPPLYEDPSDEDDGEGEWITPTNVALHKSKTLQLIPSQDSANEKVVTGCMTTDFAMQNVLMHMGLNLVGVDGKKIDKVKTWVLRCHACFKICKDSSKKFCPCCGNPTLLRASVTMSTSEDGMPKMEVHLKKNFQYKTRGTIYSIPSPKPGSAKTGSGDGLILREDQTAWMSAKKLADNKRERTERKMLNGSLARGGQGGAVMGSWMDPDWIPEMLTAGPSGKGRTTNRGDMPVIGYGRRNPNERRRKH